MVVCSVEYLLVDDDESLVSSVTQFLFQFDQLLDAVLNESAFSLNQFFTLFGRLVEEARVHLTSMLIEYYFQIFKLFKIRSREHEKTNNLTISSTSWS